MSNQATRKHVHDATKRRSMIIDFVSKKFQLEANEVERILNQRPIFNDKGLEYNSKHGLSKLLFEKFPDNKLHHYREAIQEAINNFYIL